MQALAPVPEQPVLSAKHHVLINALNRVRMRHRIPEGLRIIAHAPRRLQDRLLDLKRHPASAAAQRRANNGPHRRRKKPLRAVSSVARNHPSATKRNASGNKRTNLVM
jgi:hypothetical protein